jgi:hypothetical protein
MGVGLSMLRALRMRISRKRRYKTEQLSNFSAASQRTECRCLASVGRRERGHGRNNLEGDSSKLHRERGSSGLPLGRRTERRRTSRDVRRARPAIARAVRDTAGLAEAAPRRQSSPLLPARPRPHHHDTSVPGGWNNCRWLAMGVHRCSSFTEFLPLWLVTSGPECRQHP